MAAAGGARDVGIVLSGGGVNGVMMELGFLQRLRASRLWPRVGAIFGTRGRRRRGTMAALERLDELEQFLIGLYDYALPRTIRDWFGEPRAVAARLAEAPIELVVVATDLTDDHARGSYELVYSSRTTPPERMAEAIFASAAVSALVLPVRVGDRIATDGAWVRNFPLGTRLRPPGGGADRQLPLPAAVPAPSSRRSTRPRSASSAASRPTSPTRSCGSRASRSCATRCSRSEAPPTSTAPSPSCGRSATTCSA